MTKDISSASHQQMASVAAQGPLASPLTFVTLPGLKWQRQNTEQWEKKKKGKKNLGQYASVFEDK